MMCARNSVHDLMLCISENLNKEEYRKSITMSGKIKKTLFFKSTHYIYMQPALVLESDMEVLFLCA